MSGVLLAVLFTVEMTVMTLVTLVTVVTMVTVLTVVTVLTMVDMVQLPSPLSVSTDVFNTPTLVYQSDHRHFTH